MNCEHLTDDELIVAVAEAKGWKVVDENKAFHTHYKDKLYRLVPSGKEFVTGYVARNYDWRKLKDWANHLPDYRQPAEYMALMEEIWKTKPGSILAINGVAWNLRDGNYCDGVFGDYPRWRAICIAWLEIVGGKDDRE